MKYADHVSLLERVLTGSSYGNDFSGDREDDLPTNLSSVDSMTSSRLEDAFLGEWDLL